MKEIVFATNNLHKLEEARQIAGDRMIIRSLADINCHDEIPETAPDLKGNALIKARWIKDRYGYDCFADDTGLEVAALNGAPGVHTARYAGPECDSKANIEKLLRSLSGSKDRTARFVTAIAWVSDEEEIIFEGSVEGEIAKAPSGTSGFGYDPVFIPNEAGIPFAEMSAEAKNAISHRGRAMQKFMSFLCKKEDD